MNDYIKKVRLTPSLFGGVDVIYLLEDGTEENVGNNPDKLDQALKVSQIIQAQLIVEQVTKQINIMGQIADDTR